MDKKLKTYDQKLPYSVRIKIVQLLENKLKPRKYIELSKKQLKEREQLIAQMIQRLSIQNQNKDRITRQLNRQCLDIALYKKSKKKLYQYIHNQPPFNPLGMLVYKKKPNYFKYINHKFLEYLINYPKSKKIQISYWNNNALLFFINGDRIVAIQFQLPLDFKFNSILELKRFILENDVNITDYEYLT